MYNNIACRLKEEAFQSFFSFFLSGERCTIVAEGTLLFF
jgi:hypothetical protein